VNIFKLISNFDTIFEQTPTVPNGREYDWDAPLKRVPSFDMSFIMHENAELSQLNKHLRQKLSKKYQHIAALERKVHKLEGMLETVCLDSQSSAGTSLGPPPGLEVGESQPMTTQQITAFADQDAGWTTEIKSGYDETMNLANNADGNLGEFLNRPIRQSVQNWVVGQPFFYAFNPWKEFLTNPFIADKIKNYELIRMKMHCKMVISGTKFHYGRALASYNPLAGANYDQITVERNFLSQDLVQASQKPHFFLNPTKNTGGELCMPFFWTKNYLSITDEDADDMGEIVIKSFDNLLHANGGNDPVTITIYLWAEDVVLTMPTSTVLTSQAGKKGKKSLGAKNKSNDITSKDEYGSGIISKPAAVIAKAAGMLSELPLIAPYALATQMVAGKIGEVAKIFGYSRPAVVTDIQLFKPNPTGNFTNVDAADAVQKLTMDSKAELTLDTRTAGLDGVDQMGILDIAQRESYLTSFVWQPDEGPDTLLWNSQVTPMLFDILNTEIHPTPMSMIAQNFESWQGSVKFRFQIVKSDFHKGRILVRYDPNANSSAVEYNTNYSRVVDIAEQDDFEIVVGWGQSEPFLTCGSLSDTTVNFSDSVRLPKTQGLFNGLLELDILNDLVCPSTDSPISVNVFVSMCEDAKFAAPTNRKMNEFHVFPQVTPTPAVLESQSGMDATENPSVDETDKPMGSTEIQTIASESVETDHTYSVFYGDPPTTLRELMKRYTNTRLWVPTRPPEGVARINNLLNKDAPYQSGWDPEGIDVSDVNGTTPLTVVNKDFASWWTPCYAGFRGARRKKYLFGGGARSSPTVVRGEFSATGNGQITSSSQNFVTEAASRVAKWGTTRLARNSGAGAASTNLGINNTIEVELPFYQQTRFAPARVVRAQDLPTNSHEVVTIAATADPAVPLFQENNFNTTVSQWDAVGEDYTLMFFTGCPILYNYPLREFS